MIFVSLFFAESMGPGQAPKTISPPIRPQVFGMAVKFFFRAACGTKYNPGNSVNSWLTESVLLSGH
jgi:hypothetical protein